MFELHSLPGHTLRYIAMTQAFLPKSKYVRCKQFLQCKNPKPAIIANKLPESHRTSGATLHIKPISSTWPAISTSSTPSDSAVFAVQLFHVPQMCSGLLENLKCRANTSFSDPMPRSFLSTPIWQLEERSGSWMVSQICIPVLLMMNIVHFCAFCGSEKSCLVMRRYLRNFVPSSALAQGQVGETVGHIIKITQACIVTVGHLRTCRNHHRSMVSLMGEGCSENNILDKIESGYI